MFFTHFIRSAVVGFAAAVFVTASILSEHEGPGTRPVDFTTVPATASGSAAPVGALEDARAYADRHDLTDCVDPAHARLDDVILTVPTEPPDDAVITPVGFDEALQSGELERWNVLSCRPADHAP